MALEEDAWPPCRRVSSRCVTRLSGLRRRTPALPRRWTVAAEAAASSDGKTRKMVAREAAEAAALIATLYTLFRLPLLISASPCA